MPPGGSALTRLDEHPTVRKVRGRAAPAPEPVLDGGTLLRECLELGADDAGFVEIERAEIADQREEILALLPRARTLISFLVRMNREAIRSGADGAFNFSACYTHNYREFMGGFVDWVETLADSRDRFDYRRRVGAPATVSMWQSLGFGPNYKAAYCVAVCPAGEDVIGPFLRERARYLRDVVRPLQDKAEVVYVIRGSDAEAHVGRRFPNKKAKAVANGLQPDSISTFLSGLPLAFQPGRAAGLTATFHFAFTGEETRAATIRIADGRLEVGEGHHGEAGLRVTADTRTWIRILGKEASLAWAIVRGRIRLRGSPRLLLAFARCFPS